MKAIWRKYYFEDGLMIIARKMSADEVKHEERIHGKLISVERC